MTTVKQYIKDLVRQFDPTLDISDSSTLTDLLINPASAMLEPVISQLNYLTSNLGLKDPTAITEDELDQIASNFLIERSVGTKSTGYVELLYNNIQGVTIYKGTGFTTATGQKFLCTKDTYIDSATLAQNLWNFPKYSTGPIPVESEATGTDYSIGPNEIVATDLSPAPAAVTNPAGFSGGAPGETNMEFALRLVNEIITGALGSPDAIQTTLTKNFPTISSVQVKGMGDVEMIRDLVASGISLFNYYNNIDFYGKVSGINELPGTESLAYWNVFYDDPTTSGLLPDLPGLEVFLDQFQNSQYQGIYRKNDAHSTSIQSLVLFQDSLDVELASHWHKMDAMVGVDTVASPLEISIVDKGGIDKVRLGVRYTNTEVDSLEVKVPVRFLYFVLNQMYKVSTFPPGVALWQQPHIDTYAELVALLTLLGSGRYIDEGK